MLLPSLRSFSLLSKESKSRKNFRHGRLQWVTNFIRSRGGAGERWGGREKERNKAHREKTPKRSGSFNVSGGLAWVAFPNFSLNSLEKEREVGRPTASGKHAQDML